MTSARSSRPSLQTAGRSPIRHCAKLGWSADDDRYFKARNALEDAGLIARGRGRGGVVRHVAVESEASAEGAPAVAESPEAVAESLSRELDLYEPLARVIAADWARDHRIAPTHHRREYGSAGPSS